MVRAARRRERQAIIPSEQPANSLAGRELRAQIGQQKLRVPVEFLMAYFGQQMRHIEEWKATADPMGQMLYTGIKQSLNIMIPLLREFVKRAPDMPPMPHRERHSDPVLYLLGYINAYTVDMFTRGEFIIPVDEEGMVTGFDWTYADELARARQSALSDALPDEEEL